MSSAEPPAFLSSRSSASTRCALGTESAQLRLGGNPQSPFRSGDRQSQVDLDQNEEQREVACLGFPAAGWGDPDCPHPGLLTRPRA